VKRKKLDEAAICCATAGGTLDAAIILGSGFGGALRDRVDATPIPYKKIAGMPEPTVPGHAVKHSWEHCTAAHRCVQRRFHLYEDYDPLEIVYPVAVAAHAGAKTIVLTNAAGGVNAAYDAGDLMLIVDQLN